MTTTEIRERIDKFRDDTKRHTATIGSQQVTLYAIDVRVRAEQVVFLGEIAAQLAEFNRKIDLFTVNQSPDFKSFAVTLMEQEAEDLP